MAYTPPSSFRLTDEDLQKLERIREALEKQLPPGFRKVTASDALRYALDGTATSSNVSVDLSGKPPKQGRAAE